MSFWLESMQCWSQWSEYIWNIYLSSRVAPLHLLLDEHHPPPIVVSKTSLNASQYFSQHSASSIDVVLLAKLSLHIRLDDFKLRQRYFFKFAFSWLLQKRMKGSASKSEPHTSKEVGCPSTNVETITERQQWLWRTHYSRQTIIWHCHLTGTVSQERGPK